MKLSIAGLTLQLICDTEVDINQLKLILLFTQQLSLMDHNDAKDQVETGFDYRNDIVLLNEEDKEKDLSQKQLNIHPDHIDSTQPLQQQAQTISTTKQQQVNQHIIIPHQQSTSSNKFILTYSINQHMINDKNFIINDHFQMHQQQHQLNQQQQSLNTNIQTEMEKLSLQLLKEFHNGNIILAKSKQQQQKHQLKAQEQISQEQEHENIIVQPKLYTTQPQVITQFYPQFKSTTINCNQTCTESEQAKYYYENCKLSLTQPITSMNSSITFRIDNLKYCVGVGVGLKQILQKHHYDYKSTTSNELGHGLYLITSQGYSWSHSETEQDDIFRGQQWKNIYTGLNINLKLQAQLLTFTCKKAQFTLTIPSRIRDKYTLCFCVYLHEKTDAISIAQK